MRKMLQAESRNVEAINIKKAKQLGVLFNAEKKEQLKQAKHLLQDLNKQFPELEVHFLGWYKKEKPEGSEGLKNFHFFNKNDYGFFYEPKANVPAVGVFMERKYDIVMDLSMDFIYPIKRLLLNMDCSLRVGIFSQNNEPFFDLFINTRKDVSEFSKHAIHYLSILNDN